MKGWKTILPVGHPYIQWIQYESGLRYKETRKEDNTVEFLFYAGQQCFRRELHRKSLDRPHIFTVNNGRGFSRREDAQWVDEMGEQLHRLKG
tara:strand:- start:4475 stop:4750 length:276 start_codon:yes stop_codon:yes gene_type:complete